MDVLERIARRRVVPVAAIDDVELAIPLAEALLRAGLDIIEIAFRTPAAASAIGRIAERLPEMLVGAGTVLDSDQLARAVEAGARFAVSPGLNKHLVKAAGKAGIDLFPGVMTPTEVSKAIALGCLTLKLFPAEQAGGVGMLKALEGPYGHTGVRFIPTGGISAANMSSYLTRPSVVAVGGSWLTEKKLLQSRDWSEVERLTREALTVGKTGTFPPFSRAADHG